MTKSTTYAPDIYKSLRGILLVHKPAGIHFLELIRELRSRISDQLNEYEPRPLATNLVIDGDFGEEKKLIQVPNLADHPLVVGPRYNPWEIRMTTVPPFLSKRSSGVVPLLLGQDIKYYLPKFKKAKQVSVYQVTGRFGYITDTMFGDGKVIDKTTFKHIKPWKIDHVLSRIEGTQRDRLFEAASVPLDSEEAYELAKAWPSRPPRMAKWPLIFRLRCVHLNLPEFKFEVTVSDENENFLAHLTQDIGLSLKSSAYTESIRRVKHGIFDISDCLTSSEWDLQSIMNNLKLQSNYKKVSNYLHALSKATDIRIEHDNHQVPAKISQHQNM